MSVVSALFLCPGCPIGHRAAPARSSPRGSGRYARWAARVRELLGEVTGRLSAGRYRVEWFDRCAVTSSFRLRLDSTVAIVV